MVDEHTSQPSESRQTRRQFLGMGSALIGGALAWCESNTSVGTNSIAPWLEGQTLPDRPATIFRSDIARTGYWPEESVPDAVEEEWSIPGINVGDHTAAKSSPLYYDGDIIVPGDTGCVHSFTPEGGENWSAALFPSGHGTHSTPAIVDEYIFTAGYDGAVYALDARNGERIWRTPVSDAIGSSPVYFEGSVYVATEYYTPSGGMAALDAATGEITWEDNRMTNHAHSITGIDTDTRALAAGCNDGGLYVWDLDSLDFRGRFETGDAIKGPICMYDGKALFGSWDETVYAVDTETLEAEWTYSADNMVMAGAAVHPPSGTVVIGSHDDHVHAIDIEGGEGRWTFDARGWVVGSPNVVGDTVLAGSYDDSLFAIDISSGDLRWEFSEPSGYVTGSPAVTDGEIYVTERADGDDTGDVYKLVGA